MYILFNLSETNLIQFAVFDTESIEHKKYPAQNRELLVCLDEFLQEKKLSKKNVQGIMAVVGSGGFTSTRISVVIANTFAYVLRIPVLAITKDQVAEVQQFIPTLLAQPRGQYISASYSGEANVGERKLETRNLNYLC